jgi:hypothetical protein
MRSRHSATSCQGSQVAIWGRHRHEVSQPLGNHLAHFADRPVDQFVAAVAGQRPDLLSPKRAFPGHVQSSPGKKRITVARKAHPDMHPKQHDTERAQ